MSSDHSSATEEWQQDISFAPTAAFAQQANVKDTDIYARAEADSEGYWDDWAKQLEWSKPWETS